MTRLFVAVLVVLGLVPTLAPAVEIVNIRLCYGVGGATRKSAAFMPGDGIVITFDVTGLTKDKAGKFSYDTTFQVFDTLNDDKDEKKHKSVLGPETNESNPAPLLGGDTMPGQLVITLPPKQAPGKYRIRLTINDKIAKKASAFDYPFTVVKEDFGMVGVLAPSVHFPGQFHVLTFGLANMTLDKKQEPNAEVKIRILDDKGGQLSDVTMLLPRDMLPGTDLGKQNLVPMQYPIYLNRTGRFTVEVTAIDKAGGNRKVELRYPFEVVDVTKFTNK